MYEFGWSADCTPTPTITVTPTPTDTPTTSPTPATSFHCDFDGNTFDFGQIGIGECGSEIVIGNIWVEGPGTVTVALSKHEWDNPDLFHPEDYLLCQGTSEEMLVDSSMGQIPLCVQFCPLVSPHASRMKLTITPSAGGNVCEVYFEVGFLDELPITPANHSSCRKNHIHILRILLFRIAEQQIPGLFVQNLRNHGFLSLLSHILFRSFHR